jgi:hypothetical protein
MLRFGISSLPPRALALCQRMRPWPLCVYGAECGMWNVECSTDAPIRECLGIHCLQALGPRALLACQLSTVSVYAQLHVHRVNVVGNSLDPLWKCGGVRNQPLGCRIPAHSPAVVLIGKIAKRAQSGFGSG